MRAALLAFMAGVVVLVSAPTARAGRGAIELRSHETLSGVIVEVRPGAYVTIAFPDGTARQVPWADVLFVYDGPIVFDSSGATTTFGNAAVPSAVPAAPAPTAPEPGVEGPFNLARAAPVATPVDRERPPVATGMALRPRPDPFAGSRLLPFSEGQRRTRFGRRLIACGLTIGTGVNVFVTGILASRGAEIRPTRGSFYTFLSLSTTFVIGGSVSVARGRQIMRRAREAAAW